MKDTVHFARPLDNVLQLGLREGMIVGDLGAGSGHYALAAAHIVGDAGRVYAVDVQMDMLARIKSDAKDKNLSNIETVWGDISRREGTLLKDHSLDAAILSNTLFQIENKSELFLELKRILKSGGKVLVVDWAGAYGGIGPAPHQVISEHDAERLFIEQGFHKVKSFRGGPHHYALVLAAP